MSIKTETQCSEMINYYFVLNYPV